MDGTYLIHFEKPINPKVPFGLTLQWNDAMHYAGYSKFLKDRFLKHFTGKGSRITQRAYFANIKMKVVKIWHENIESEVMRKATSFCPICNKE